MSYCSRSCRRRYTVLNFKNWAYIRICDHFEHICTAHAQKRLFMNFRCKFKQCHSIRRPRFPVRVQNFGDLATFSVDFCILYAECPLYFYFRLVWPTDLKSVPHASTPTLIIPTTFKVDMTIHCRVTAFLSADRSRDFATLTFDLLTLNSWSTWRVKWPTLPPSMKTLRLSVLELWVITFPVGYHWKCVRCHCACAELRDPWVGIKNSYIFGMLDPDLPIHYATSVALRWNWLKLSAKMMHGPVLKVVWVSAHARNHAIC